MTSLFEIKIGRDAQSIFTAIGQLIVYSTHNGATKPRRILVTQGLPKSKLFTTAINHHGIEIIFYELSPKVKFRNLATILDG